jgi:hypothetical protein
MMPGNHGGKTVKDGATSGPTDFQQKARDLKKLLDDLESGNIGAK